jgi:hypothetical protein
MVACGVPAETPPPSRRRADPAVERHLDAAMRNDLLTGLADPVRWHSVSIQRFPAGAAELAVMAARFGWAPPEAALVQRTSHGSSERWLA